LCHSCPNGIQPGGHFIVPFFIYQKEEIKKPISKSDELEYVLLYCFKL